MEGQVGIDRVIGARIRNADKNINKKYKDITNPKDPNTAENLLRSLNFMSDNVYLGNQSKKANTPIEWTEEMMNNSLSVEDPVYFANNHVRLSH